MGRALAKSRDGMGCLTFRPVIVKSNVVLHSRFSGKFHVYGPQYRVENQYDDFVKVMPRY